jgi:hypothetical protein
MGVAGLLLLVAGAPNVTASSSDADISKAFASPVPTWVMLGAYLHSVSVFFFLLFAARLWFTLRRGEGATDWLSAAALGGAFIFVAIALGSDAGFDPLMLRAGHGLGPAEARTLMDLGVSFHVLTWLASGSFLAITAAVALLKHGLPAWLGWAAAGVAVAQLAAAAAPAAAWAQSTELLFLLWVLAASVTLTLSRGG